MVTLILILLESIMLCFILLLSCVIGIANGPERFTVFYEKDVQKSHKARLHYEKGGSLAGDCDAVTHGQWSNIRTEELRSIKVPTLVIAGSNEIIKECHTREIASNIFNATLVIIKGGHFISEKQSDVFNREIEKFLTMQFNNSQFKIQ